MEIKDSLDEVIFLKNPKIMVCEWIPFNKNQIMTINEDLETSKRIKSNLFTSRTDTAPHTMTFVTNPIFTEVHINQYDAARYVNFDAQVFYPEDVVQIEKFGVNIDFSGRVIYGLSLIEVDNKKTIHSLDKIARVISDVILDSTVMVDTLLSVFQKRLLDVVFFDDSSERDKFAVIIADEITPHFDDDSKYMDKEAHENELNQIIESVNKVVTLSEKEKVFVGGHGIIVISPDNKQYESTLSVAAFLYSLKILQKNVSTRMWMLWDHIRETREKIVNVSESDAQTISQIQHALSEISGTIVLLDEITKYMDHSTAYIEREWQSLHKNNLDNAKVCDLAKALDIEKEVKTRSAIIGDIKMGISGLKNEIQGLRDIATSISEKQMRKVNEALQENIVEMQEMTRSSERTSSAVEVLEIILAGSISFDIVNTFSGEYSNEFISSIAGTYPHLWFVAILCVWIVIGYALYKIMNRLEAGSEKDLRVNIRFDKKADPEALEEYIQDKNILMADNYVDENTQLARLSWKDDLAGQETIIQITYEKKSSMIRHISADVPGPKDIKVEDIKAALIEELKNAKLFSEKFISSI